MERLKSKKENLRVSTIDDYFLFKRLTTEAQLNDLIDVIWLNVGEMGLFRDTPYLNSAKLGLRIMALQKERSSRWFREEGHHTSYSSSDKSEKIVICRDENNQIICKANIFNLPFPAHDLLLQAGRGGKWREVCFWKLLGEGKNIMDFLTPTGCLLFKQAGVFLFTDELYRLLKGEFVIAPSSDAFEGYQIINGEIFRIWAEYTD